jgi:hypothetical protein
MIASKIGCHGIERGMKDDTVLVCRLDARAKTTIR